MCHVCGAFIPYAGGYWGSKIIMGVLLDETLKEHSVIVTTFYGMNQKI